MPLQINLMPVPHLVLAQSPELLASILHELRNPLTAAMAHIEMLSEGVCGPLSSPQADAVETLRQQLNQAFRLTDDLGEIWLGRPSPKSSASAACEGHLLCLRALEQNAALAQSRGVQVALVEPHGSLCLSDDIVHLDRLISGLVACGLQLVPRGSRIRLVIERVEKGAFVGLRGDEISAPPSDSAVLDNSVAQLQRIKPIGLLLLQRWASLMGASLVAHATTCGWSALGLLLPAGSVPGLRLDGSFDPLAARASDDPQSASTSAPSTTCEPPLVLIADDQAALTTVVRTYLEDLGLRVIVAHDGHQAIQHAFSDRPRLIIMDVRMPMLDGLQALEKIRASNDPVIASTPVICVSGYAAPGEQERCVKAGATAFLRKPFGVQHLLELVIRYFPEIGADRP